MKPRRLLALLLTVGCSKGQPQPPVVTVDRPLGQPPPELTVDRSAGQPPPERTVGRAEEPSWDSLYGTGCVFHEGPEVPCPRATAIPQEKLVSPGATVCCPASFEASVPPPVPAEPPWPPQPCLHTGVSECDAWVAAQYAFWKRSAPAERAGLRRNLDLGCGAYAYAPITSGRGIAGLRLDCTVGHESLKHFLRTHPQAVAPMPAPAPPPAPLTRQQALATIGFALRHQLTPQVCPHTLDECDAYTAAFYACWRRATPEARSFLEGDLAVDCSMWSRSAATNGGAGLRELCQAALAAVVEHPACKP